jgi:hypothetical protein
VGTYLRSGLAFSTRFVLHNRYVYSVIKKTANLRKREREREREREYKEEIQKHVLAATARIEPWFVLLYNTTSVLRQE